MQRGRGRKPAGSIVGTVISDPFASRAPAMAAASAATIATPAGGADDGATTKSGVTGVERSVFWRDGKVWMIDQQALPSEFKVISAATLEGEGGPRGCGARGAHFARRRVAAEVIKAIKDMTVRGAPAIGAAGAFGLALAAFASTAADVCVLAAACRACVRMRTPMPRGGFHGIAGLRWQRRCGG